MKGKNKILILLSILFLFSAILLSCNNEQEKDSKQEYLIAGFESYKELSAMSWLNEFGIINLVEDKQYVKQGKYAIKVELTGNPEKGPAYRPEIVLYTNNDFIEKTDYSDCDSYLIDIYNASDKATNVYFQFKSGSLSKSGMSSEQVFELKPNSWNEIRFEINRPFVANFIDIDQISNFYLKFENREKGEVPIVLYIDNFRASITDEAFDPNIKIREDDELESAEYAEYLSAWEASDHSTLSYNTDERYVLEGKGSFKWYCPAAGQVNWPRLDFKGNILKDLTPYESIYFWIYNDNPDDYEIVIGGKTSCGIAVANQWSLIEISVAFLANVPTFNDDGFEFDVTNFNNFNMVVTNNNKTLTFYVDAFYARRAGEPIRGQQPSGKDIVLNVERNYESVLSGTTVVVPKVQNAEDYKEIIWTVAVTGMTGAYYTKIINPELNNAESFTVYDNNAYTVTYTAEDHEGLKAYAKYTFLSYTSDVKGLDITIGSSGDLTKTFTETPMNGDYVKPNITLETENIYRFENGVKITYSKTTKVTNYAFCWKPRFDARQYDGIIFSFLNTGDKDIFIQSAWGAIIVLNRNEYTVFTANIESIMAWATGAPDVHSYNPLEISFYTNSVILNSDLDIIMSVATYGEKDLPLELSLDNFSDIITSERNVSISRNGIDDIALHAPDKADITWTIFTNGVKVGSYSDTMTYTVNTSGVHEIKFNVSHNGKNGSVSYFIYYETAHGYELSSDMFRQEPDKINYIVPSDISPSMKHSPFGSQTVKITGNSNPSGKIGFSFYTNITGILNSVALYYYNDSEASITLSYAWGSLIELKPHVWTRVYMSNDFQAWADGWNSNSQVKRLENGEWVFFMPMDISRINGEYIIYIAAAIDYVSETPKLALPKIVDYSYWNNDYAIPQVEGAEYKIYRVFGGNEENPNSALVPLSETDVAISNYGGQKWKGIRTWFDGNNDYGRYDIVYSKTENGITYYGTLTVFVLAIESVNNGIDLKAEDLANINNTVSVENCPEYGFSHSPAIKITGATRYTEYKVKINTHITEDIVRIRYYMYNASSVEVGHIRPGGEYLMLPPQEWTVINAFYYLISWNETYKNEQGEWVIELSFDFQGFSQTGYDIMLFITFELGIPA